MPAPWRLSIVTRIAAVPAQPLAAILFVHTVVCTALPTLLYATLAVDLLEALTYVREWQRGYDKLQPVPWWMVEFVLRLIGHALAYYLLAQLVVVIALWLIWLSALP